MTIKITKRKLGIGLWVLLILGFLFFITYPFYVKFGWGFLIIPGSVICFALLCLLADYLTSSVGPYGTDNWHDYE